MTDEQINIAIAEACGWTDIRREPTFGYGTNHLWWAYPPMKTGQGGNAYQYLPNYCNDLNAMREAEERLDDKQRRDFAFRLLLALCDGSAADLSEHFDLLHATARQRAEAFLRVL